MPDPKDQTNAQNVNLREALRLLWRYGWQEAPDRDRVVRFALLYLAVGTAALLAGGAVLLIVLGVLRGAFLAAPLYPRWNDWLHRWGWPARSEGWEAAPSFWRTLHTALWIVLSTAAVGLGFFYLWHNGFCAQNLFCRLLNP